MDDFEREMKTGFLDEAEQMLADAEQCFLGIEKSVNDPTLKAQIFEQILRLAHNIKGSAAAVGFEELSKFTHHFESLLLKVKKNEVATDAAVVGLLLKGNDQMRVMLKELKEDLTAHFDNGALINEIMTATANSVHVKPAAEAAWTPSASTAAPQPVSMAVSEYSPAVTASATAEPAGEAGGGKVAVASGTESIRVSLERLDALINHVGELVIAQTFLSEYKESLGVLSEDEALQKQISELEKITSEIQHISMSLRMVPLRQTFQKMQRIVRDTSKAVGKEVIFFTTGDDTEIDKTVLERIGDPLVHLIRNAVDHGLESADARRAAKKVPSGTIHLSAHHQGGNIVIEVRDDGGGLDAAKLLAKAIEKGILPAGAQLSDNDAYQLIFAPGFSTKAEVSELSGRGVGMDVVRSNIKALQGTIQIQTRLGHGTCFRVILPLTLAIVDGMIVRLGGERYIVPLANISESVRPRRQDVDVASPGTVETIRHRGETLPVFRLAELLGRPNAHPNAWESIALVVRDLKEHPFSLLVDDIVGSQQVVIKPLGADIAGLPGIAGGAILGDGQAALILDINQIIEAAS